jgi:hypothetical protein
MKRPDVLSTALAVIEPPDDQSAATALLAKATPRRAALTDTLPSDGGCGSVADDEESTWYYK